MKVGIFLKTTGPGEKQRVLLDFAKGVEKVKSDQLLVSSKYEYADCDIAVIFGFFGKNRGNTQNFRKTIYDTHTARKKHCILKSQGSVSTPFVDQLLLPSPIPLFIQIRICSPLSLYGKS